MRQLRPAMRRGGEEPAKLGTPLRLRHRRRRHRLCARRTWTPCASATPAASRCAPRAARRRTAPKSSPAMRSCRSASAPKPSTRSAVSTARGRRAVPCRTGQDVPVPCSTARGALHHVLHREEVHALHQLLQGHAGVSVPVSPYASPWPRVPAVPSCPPRHRESRAHCIDIETAYVQGCEKLDQAVLVGERGVRCRATAVPQPPCCPAGSEGAADIHTGGHRPPQGHDRGGAQQCQRGGVSHQRPVQWHAGAGLWGCARGCPSSPVPCSVVLALS